MKKGFFFTVDAAFAVVAAATLIIALVALQESEKGKEKAFGIVAQKARDSAITGFYLLGSITGDIPPAKQYYYCSNIVRYDPNNGAGQATPTTIKKCGEFP